MRSFIICTTTTTTAAAATATTNPTTTITTTLLPPPPPSSPGSDCQYGTVPEAYESPKGLRKIFRPKNSQMTKMRVKIF
jgi:hypothetical protein